MLKIRAIQRLKKETFWVIFKHCFMDGRNAYFEMEKQANCLAKK